ncbi:MAG: hypothetical protein BWY70_00906 [Bacteroidetes bacterium ADurb.Bin408]|nr:MAG: hypothetical protein BWY70_00906 [Bacteroidetes bacterium ADurb.Bin408]
MPKRKKGNIKSVSEPDVNYSLSSLHKGEGIEMVISSFEEQEEANYTYWLSLTPEERFELHYKMLGVIYKENLMKKKKNKKIKFNI